MKEWLTSKLVVTKWRQLLAVFVLLLAGEMVPHFFWWTIVFVFIAYWLMDG